MRPRILDILVEMDESAADLTLAAGLEHVPPALQVELVALLIERGDDTAMMSLPELFDTLPPDARDLVTHNIDKLYAVLRNTSRSRSTQARLNTIDIVHRAGCVQLAYLAGIGVHDGAMPVREAAARTLLRFAAIHEDNVEQLRTRLRADPPTDPVRLREATGQLRQIRDERISLCGAIADALGTFNTHHRTEVLDAAMLFAEGLEEALFKHGHQKRTTIATTAVEAFIDAPAPRHAIFAYIALRQPETRQKIAAVISRNTNEALFAELMRHRWLARDPVIRANLRAIKHVAWLEDGLSAAFSLPTGVSEHAPDWILNLGIPTDKKIAALTHFLLLDHPPTQRAAAWALTRIRTPAATAALEGMLDHESEAVRRIAKREVQHRRRSPARPVSAMQSDRPARWVELLHQSGLTEDFEPFWAHYDRIPEPQAASTAHLALQYVPSFSTELQVRLMSAATADRLRAVRMILAMRLATHFQKDLYRMANDPSPEIRAAVMSALGQVANETGRRILERALSDDDAAVQAAALDALDASAAKGRAEAALGKLNCGVADVRAAAIRLLLRTRTPEAVPALMSMLHDARPEHRCSALWIVEQLRLVPIIPRIEALAREDADSRIVRIAQHVLKRLRRTKPGFETTAGAPSEPAAMSA